VLLTAFYSDINLSLPNMDPLQIYLLIELLIEFIIILCSEALVNPKLAKGCFKFMSLFFIKKSFMCSTRPA